MSAPAPLPLPDMAGSLIRIEVKLDVSLQQLGDHEARLRALEGRNWPKQSINVLLTAGSTAAAVLAVVVPLFLR